MNEMYVWNTCINIKNAYYIHIKPFFSVVIKYSNKKSFYLLKSHDIIFCFILIQKWAKYLWENPFLELFDREMNLLINMLYKVSQYFTALKLESKHFLKYILECKLNEMFIKYKYFSKWQLLENLYFRVNAMQIAHHLHFQKYKHLLIFARAMVA